MTPLSFFRSKEVQRIVRRAARISGSPITLHTVRHGTESPRVLSTGGCAACALVAGSWEGRDACARSRVPHSERALRRKTPVPFICHMGFVCVSVAPLTDADAPYVLTLGPYCAVPRAAGGSVAAATAATERSVQAGLVRLNLAGQDLSDLLGDVAAVQADVVPATAEWLAETLRSLWHAQQSSAAVEETPASPEPATRAMVGRSKRPDADPYAAAAIAAAAIAGDRAGARRLIATAMGELRREDTPRGQARLLAIMGASLEAMLRAGATLKTPWGELAGRITEIMSTHNTMEWPAAAARLLSTGVAQSPPEGTTLVERVDAMLDGRVADAPSLNAVAAALGCTPSAVTHALQRKFGMSYSQYLGRLRIASAKDLLRRTRLSPSEIGRRVGIHDTSNFARLFKKFEGITPLEYRTRFGARR